MVPFGDVGVDGVDELTQRPKGSSPDGLSSDDAEPDLHLVEPGRPGWREVKVKARMARQPCTSLRVFVRTVIINDKMHVEPRWNAASICFKKPRTPGGGGVPYTE